MIDNIIDIPGFKERLEQILKEVIQRAVVRAIEDVIEADRFEWKIPKAFSTPSGFRSSSQES